MRVLPWILAASAAFVCGLAFLYAVPHAWGAEPRTGDPLPALTLKLDDGTELQIAEAKKPLVLYFYPKDDTPGCTKQGCTFRDRWADIEKRGALVVGISFDDAASHKKFKEKHGLTFSLATDDGSAAEAFGVKVRGVRPLRFHARDTIVAGADGKVRAILRGVDPVAGFDQVIAALDAK